MSLLSDLAPVGRVAAVAVGAVAAVSLAVHWNRPSEAFRRLHALLQGHRVLAAGTVEPIGCAVENCADRSGMVYRIRRSDVCFAAASPLAPLETAFLALDGTRVLLIAEDPEGNAGEQAVTRWPCPNAS